MNSDWSDERIAEIVESHSVFEDCGVDCVSSETARECYTLLRDDMQKRIEELEADNERLRSENDMLFTRAAKRLAAIKELQARESESKDA